jgi:hypothetical protein
MATAFLHLLHILSSTIGVLWSTDQFEISSLHSERGVGIFYMKLANTSGEAGLGTALYEPLSFSFL